MEQPEIAQGLLPKLDQRLVQAARRDRCGLGPHRQSSCGVALWSSISNIGTLLSAAQQQARMLLSCLRRSWVRAPRGVGRARCGRMPSHAKMNANQLKDLAAGRAVRHWTQKRTAAKRRTNKTRHRWCPGAELNHRHTDFQSVALPTELPGRLRRGALIEEVPFSCPVGRLPRSPGTARSF
jgi:hypothetical protein